MSYPRLASMGMPMATKKPDQPDEPSSSGSPSPKTSSGSLEEFLSRTPSARPELDKIMSDFASSVVQGTSKARPATKGATSARARAETPPSPSAATEQAAPASQEPFAPLIDPLINGDDVARAAVLDAIRADVAL